jgi:hypothetical protein
MKLKIKFKKSNEIGVEIENKIQIKLKTKFIK